jgi:hypothetical protein
VVLRKLARVALALCAPLTNAQSGASAIRVLPRSALYNGVLRREVMRFVVLIVFLGASLGEASLVVNDCRVRPPKVATGRGALIRRSFSAGIFRVQFTDNSAVALR